MQKTWLWAVVPGILIGVAGCPDVKSDPDEVGTRPVVEFDPGNRIIPFPNNLLIDPMTGRVNLPASFCESPASTATRTMVLNQLDGFGTYEVAMSVTFTEPVDMASLTGKVVLYKRISGMTPVDPAAATAIPVITIPGMSVRFPTEDSCDTPVLVSSLTIVPMVPLEQRSFYTIGLLDGIQTADGDPYGPSSTWALISQPENPVTVDADGTLISERTPLDPANPEELASILGINQLYNAHKGPLDFLTAKGHTRDQLLLAWEFKTQTVTDPLDPAVATSPAAAVAAAPLLGVQSITCDLDATTCPKGINRALPPYSECPTGGGGDTNVECFLKIAIGSLQAPAGSPPAVIYATGDATCPLVGCAAVRDVVAGAVNSAQYQSETPNPFDAAKPIPGQWSDPYQPMKVKDALIEVLGFVPAAATPVAGYSTIVFGHGLGSTKKAAFAIAPQLAVQGFMTVAIDFAAHDSRAVRISDAAATGCDDASAPTPGSAPQCYAPFLSPNLGATRDNIRQSVLDVLGLVAGLKACGTSACTAAVPAFQANPASIQYLGQSLGGIIGSAVTAVAPDLKAAVLNVAGVGWVDILENTESLAIRCSLVNGLIDAGVVTGDKWTGGATGLCTTDAWKTQPGYRQFSAIGRWVLDPADPANFTPKLAAKRFLLQEVVGDEVVPNVATDREAALTATTGAAAACAPPTSIAPSPAILTTPMTKKFLTYTDLPAGTCSAQAFPGNTFEHASLLRPAKGFCTTDTTVRCSVDLECPTNDTCNALSVGAGRLGTARLQTDAITYLVLNK